MKREIVFDTETTGFTPYDSEGQKSNRIVEIGAIELVDGEPTGKTYHQYINPEMEIPAQTTEVHGIDNARVANEPTFAQITNDFLAFIGEDSTLIAHNADFDMRFINAELLWAGADAIPDTRVEDTLKIAKQKFPGETVSLDALCKKFDIDNSHRTTHGALLDAELLVAVYKKLK